MCRISAIRGKQFYNKPTIKLIEDMQQCGATIDAEVFGDKDFSIIASRFDVTSSTFLKGNFPLQDAKYVLSYNGEIYSFRENAYTESDFESDVHFGLHFINLFGHQAFFKEADFEGTFFVYEKHTQKLFVYADQLNTKGCFYAKCAEGIVVSQEVSIINQVLELNNIDSQIPIHSLKRGYCLEIDNQNQTTVSEYKPDFRHIFSGTSINENTFTDALVNAFVKATIDRIPKEGDFGVLCSGGVDSSVILKLVHDHLKQQKQTHRLKIFTLGSERNKLKGENNDLQNAKKLLKHLGIDEAASFVEIRMDDNWRNFLFENEIFNNPRLITPNPAQTQVRHTIMLSCVLAKIVLLNPTIKVILTGDFADEIFGGYNSMHTGSISQLMHNIQEKLEDLHLNDASRVTLASLRGCKRILQHLNAPQQQPIEIRTPYASPLIARAIKNCSEKLTVGIYDGSWHAKFLVRLVAQKLDLPQDIVWRKKIPFNEGGTGIRNAEKDLLEEKNGSEYLLRQSASIEEQIDDDIMANLGLDTQALFERAICHSSLGNGLGRLLLGNSFRPQMPDSNYSTKGSLTELYTPKDGQ